MSEKVLVHWMEAGEGIFGIRCAGWCPKMVVVSGMASVRGKSRKGGMGQGHIWRDLNINAKSLRLFSGFPPVSPLG